jgi:vacuolar-type H+-ATPase subunit F/Vma7
MKLTISLVFNGSETSPANIEAAFAEFTERNDIAILLINQHVRPISSLHLRSLVHLSSSLTFRSHAL